MRGDRLNPALRVVALAYYFAPANDSASIRNTKILRHLGQFGVHLDLITIDAKDVTSPVNPELLDQVPGHVNIVRTRCVYPYTWPLKLKRLTMTPARDEPQAGGAGSAKARKKSRWQTFKDLVSYALMVPDKQVCWYPFALWAGYRHMRRSKSDVIYAVGQPWTAFFVGYTLKLLSGKPLVVDFMDPWASRAQAWDHDKPKFLGRIAARLESFVVRRADFIVANTEELAADFMNRFHLSPRAMRVITCGFDPADFQGLPVHSGGEMFVITHTGSCYGLRSPINLLRAVKTLLDTGRIPTGAIRLNFIGNVPVHDPQLRALLADPVLEGVVTIESWVPHASALESLSRSDVLLVMQPGLHLAVPAKLYQYAAIGRPILALAEPDGAVARVVRQAKLGVTVPNEDLEGIAREVERLYVQFRHGRLTPAYTPSDIAQYRVDNLAAALSSVFHQVGRPTGHN